MAEISVERKPRSPLPILLGLLLLAAVAFAVWRYMGSRDTADANPPVVTDTAPR